MRTIAAIVTGILVLRISLYLIREAAGAFGIVPAVPLPYPMELSYGRYDYGLVESDHTLFGMASFFAAGYLGLTTGYMVYRMSLLPWRTAYERATATAWAAFLVFTVFYSAAVQLVFPVHTNSSWLENVSVDLITHAPPAFVGWRLWRWWKRASTTSVPPEG